MTTDDQNCYRVYVCHNVQCRQRDVSRVWRALQLEVSALGLDDRVELIVSGCLSRCEYGPNINVYPRLTKYAAVTPELARQIVQQHFVQGQPVTAALFDDPYR